MNTLELDTKLTYCFMVSEVHDKSRDYRYCFMVSEVHDPVYRHCFMVSEEWKIWNFISKRIDARISTRISLYHSGFKGPAISTVLKNSDFQ